jgi:hypothetical protein
VKWVKCRTVDGSTVYLNLARAQAVHPPNGGNTTCIEFGGEEAYEVMEGPRDLIEVKGPRDLIEADERTVPLRSSRA